MNAGTTAALSFAVFVGSIEAHSVGKVGWSASVVAGRASNGKTEKILFVFSFGIIVREENKGGAEVGACSERHGWPP